MVLLSDRQTRDTELETCAKRLFLRVANRLLRPDRLQFSNQTTCRLPMYSRFAVCENKRDAAGRDNILGYIRHHIPNELSGVFQLVNAWKAIGHAVSYFYAVRLH